MGDRLAAAGRNEEARRAYEEAAYAYQQTPEASRAPIERSERAHAKAARLGDAGG